MVEPVDWLHHWRQGDDIVLSLARHGPDHHLMRVPGWADFRMDRGQRHIEVVPLVDALDPATLEHLLVDQVLPRVLAGTGRFMAHASALSINGQVALFSGPSGHGKSTLAAIFRLAGHELLSDDCLQLQPGVGGVTALPTYPGLRLRADSRQALWPGTLSASPNVARYSDKQRLAVAGDSHGMTPRAVSAFYLLGSPLPGSTSVAITPLPAAAAFQALLQHSFRFDVSDKAETARQFALCSAVARMLPAYLLQYPRDYSRSRELAGEITLHLAAQAGRH